jgi:FkbM family methyltransferase
MNRPPLTAVAPPYVLVQARHGWMLANSNDFYLGGALLKYGEYAELEFRLLRQLLFRPGLVLEVGANMGAHTISLGHELARQQRSMVVFEPQPFVFQNLCANLALNALNNVRAWPFACGAGNQQVFFDSPDYVSLGNFGAVSMQHQAAPGRIAVPCVPLDEVLGAEPVALIKIDVEGFELQVLQGAQQILTQSRPLLYLENNQIDKSQQLIEWIWQHNYRLWWHTPPLFNPDNFFGVTENIYGRAASFNMLAIPEEIPAQGLQLQAITDARHHPLAPGN